MVKKIQIFIIQALIVISFFVIWELVANFELIKPFYISSPSRVFMYLKTGLIQGNLIHHLLITLNEAFWGLIVGILSGTLFAIIFALNKRIDKIFQPFLSMFNAMPRLAFAPIIMLWFGFGLISKVLIVVSMVFFVMFFNIYQGLKEINPILLKNSRTLGATRKQILLHIFLPSILGWIYSSLRLSVAYSIISAIIGEYVGANAGLGYLIDNAQSMFDSTAVFGGLIILMLVVLIIDNVIQFSEKYIIKWR